ncbi:MAG: chorismate-binding protein [Alloprevotella sp.]|nr:chorismate-binding protein [Alloprevotella sp.]
MKSYALYRLPRSAQAVRIECGDKPRVLRSITEADAAEGYLIAPFLTDADTPIVLLTPDTVSTIPVPSSLPATDILPLPHPPSDLSRTAREAYAKEFHQAHALLSTDACRKIVLARTEAVPLPSTVDDYTYLFIYACQLYPQCFVALFSTPQTGTWLTATPETLLEADGGRWRTMALAGTMGQGGNGPATPPTWNAKNKLEQALVTEFIRTELADITPALGIGTPHTRYIGSIAHLQTDISFSRDRHTGIGTLLQRLHPTPAVSGLPRRAACEAIARIESVPRRYYAGYSGPLHLQGDTRLFVTLRCMELFPGKAILHAGGGLLAESTEVDEWAETCRKLEAVRAILAAPYPPKLTD